MKKNIIPHSKSTLNNEDLQSIVDTFKKGIITGGIKNTAFTKALSKYLNKEHVFLFSSGSMAIYNVLLALDIHNDDEVLLPNYLCFSVYKAVKLTGAKAVLYDNEKNLWISSYKQIKSKISNRTKAIIIVHTFGIQFSNIKKVAKLGIPIIEDCAQAFSTHINEKPISQYSCCSFYSFNAIKCLATGEGGAIATNDAYLSKKIQENSLDKGLSDLNCALGLSQLKRYDYFLSRRKEIAEYYFENLNDIAKELKVLNSLYYKFPIFIKNDSGFLKSNVLFKKGMDSLINQRLNIEDGNFINANNVFKKTISIPIYPSLSQKEMKIIVNETKRLYGS